MRVDLTTEQIEELTGLLQVSLRELSHEIAKTEHPSYRASLARRRLVLAQVLGALSAGHLASFGEDGADELWRELSHPGA